MVASTRILTTEIKLQCKIGQRLEAKIMLSLKFCPMKPMPNRCNSVTSGQAFSASCVPRTWMACLSLRHRFPFLLTTSPIRYFMQASENIEK